MSNTKHTVLMNEWQPSSEDCRSFREDLRIAITLNPSLEKIEAAMDVYATQYADNQNSSLLEALKEMVRQFKPEFQNWNQESAVEHALNAIKQAESNV